MTHVSPANADTDGYTEAEGYAASLRQQADLMEKANAGKVSAYVAIDDFDVDGLRSAADFVERKDQSLVEEGGSIPPLAATTQASVNLDLLDACKCAAEWLSGWASAEPYMSQLETAIARASSLSSPESQS